MILPREVKLNKKSYETVVTANFLSNRPSTSTPTMATRLIPSTFNDSARCRYFHSTALDYFCKRVKIPAPRSTTGPIRPLLRRNFRGEPAFHPRTATPVAWIKNHPARREDIVSRIRWERWTGSLLELISGSRLTPSHRGRCSHHGRIHGTIRYHSRIQRWTVAIADVCSFWSDIVYYLLSCAMVIIVYCINIWNTWW